MNPLVVAGFGTSINVDRRRLIIENRLEKTRQEFLPFQISYDSIFIDGNYGVISFEALRWLSAHKIPVSLLQWNGNLMSVVLPREPISGKLKIRQYEAYLDKEKRQSIASSIIKEKVRQSLNLLMELSKYYHQIDPKKIESSFLNEYKFYERSEKGIDSIMTHEGRIADIYWNNLYKVFNDLYPEFNFKSRNNSLNSHNRNSADPINAMLNYGYSVLDSLVRRSINSIGFDPSIAFLHELSDSRASLACDLMEIGRWAVDLSVIELLEEKKLKNKDFLVTEHLHIRLRETTSKMLVEKIKSNFNNRAFYRKANFTYENILFNEIRKVANYVIGKQDKLEFSIPLVKIKRNDDLELRNRIANIDYKERKRLKMNKSTLWYQQQNLKQGKRIKLYRKTK
jgi:CRISPR-associated protein Cas1